METEYKYVDRSYRKKLFAVYAVVLITLIISTRLIAPSILSRLNELHGEERIFFIEKISFSLLLLAVPSALYLVWVGIQIIASNQFPYPTMQVLRKTAIIRGRKARVRGFVTILLGVFTCAIIVGSILFTQRINRTFIDDPLHYRPIFFINR